MLKKKLYSHMIVLMKDNKNACEHMKSYISNYFELHGVNTDTERNVTQCFIDWVEYVQNAGVGY